MTSIYVFTVQLVWGILVTFSQCMRRNGYLWACV